MRNLFFLALFCSYTLPYYSYDDPRSTHWALLWGSNELTQNNNSHQNNLNNRAITNQLLQNQSSKFEQIERTCMHPLSAFVGLTFGVSLTATGVVFKLVYDNDIVFWILTTPGTLSLTYGLSGMIYGCCNATYQTVTCQNDQESEEENDQNNENNV